MITDHDPPDVIGLDKKNTAMPLASSKQLPMMSLLHYLMLTLFHSRFLLPVPKLAHRLYNAAASSPSRPREGDSLAINMFKWLIVIKDIEVRKQLEKLR